VKVWTMEEKVSAIPFFIKYTSLLVSAIPFFC
jgi:hypothetical protein